MSSRKAVAEQVTPSDRTISESSKERWDEFVESTSMAHADLHQPTPDFAFGLKAIVPRFASSRIDLMPVLSLNFLLRLVAEKQIHPFPASSTFALSFPFLVIEVESDNSPLFHAETRAANGIAKALKILGILETKYQEASGVVDSPLPVIAICCAGSMCEVMIAYRTTSPDHGQRWVGSEGTLWLCLSSPNLIP